MFLMKTKGHSRHALPCILGVIEFVPTPGSTIPVKNFMRSVTATSSVSGVSSTPQSPYKLYAWWVRSVIPPVIHMLNEKISRG
jgi:hypothetical protein